MLWVLRNEELTINDVYSSKSIYSTIIVEAELLPTIYHCSSSFIFRTYYMWSISQSWSKNQISTRAVLKLKIFLALHENAKIIAKNLSQYLKHDTLTEGHTDGWTDGRTENHQVTICLYALQRGLIISSYKYINIHTYPASCSLMHLYING